MTELLDISDFLDDLSDNEKLIITRRALLALDVDFDWIGGDEPHIQIGDSFLDLAEDDDFRDEWAWQAKLFIVQQITTDALAEGLLEIDGINEDGEIQYRVRDGVDIDGLTG